MRTPYTLFFIDLLLGKEVRNHNWMTSLRSPYPYLREYVPHWYHPFRDGTHKLLYLSDFSYINSN